MENRVETSFLPKNSSLIFFFSINLNNYSKDTILNRVVHTLRIYNFIVLNLFM
jgi:hypothetical protein